MELKQSNGEKVLKSWDYGKSRTAKANLTVTDKRIVSTVEHNKGIDRAEMTLEKVKTVDVFYGKPKRSVGKLIGIAVLLAFGAFYCVGSFVIIPKISDTIQAAFSGSISSAIQPVTLTIGAVLLVLGVLLLILNPKVLVLSFAAREDNCNGLSFGRVNEKIKRKKIKRNSKKPPFLQIVLIYALYLGFWSFSRAGAMLNVMISLVWILIIIAIISVYEKDRTKKRRVGKANKNHNKIKLKVSASVAREIANELGATLLNATAA